MPPHINDLLIAGLQSQDPDTVSKFQEFSIHLGHVFSPEDIGCALTSTSSIVRAFAVQHKASMSNQEILDILYTDDYESKLALARRDDIILTDEHYTVVIQDSNPLVVMAFIRRKTYFPTSEHVHLANSHKNFSVRCFFEKWKWMT